MTDNKKMEVEMESKYTMKQIMDALMMVNEKVLVQAIASGDRDLMEKEIIKYLPKGCEKKQPELDKWIPCSERLPEQYKDVLVSMKKMDKVYAMFHDGTRWCFTDLRKGYEYCEVQDDIVAWMPLPLPEQYKEG